MAVQEETIFFTVGIFLLCFLLLVVDFALKKWYQPYLANKRHSHVTVTKAGIFGTEAVRKVMAEHDGRAKDYEKRVRKIIRECYQKFSKAAESSGTAMGIVSGWTDDGVNAVAYEVAKAFKWKVEGIACKEAMQNRPLYKCDETTVAGTHPGDEKSTLMKRVDMLVLISDNSDPEDPYEVVFNDFGGMKLRFDLSKKELAPPEVYNTATFLDEDENQKNK